MLHNGRHRSWKYYLSFKNPYYIKFQRKPNILSSKLLHDTHCFCTISSMPSPPQEGLYALYQADSLFPALRTLSYCHTTVKEGQGGILDYYTLTSNRYAQRGLSSPFASIQTHLAMISPRHNDT